MIRLLSKGGFRTDFLALDFSYSAAFFLPRFDTRPFALVRLVYEREAHLACGSTATSAEARVSQPEKGRHRSALGGRGEIHWQPRLRRKIRSLSLL